MSPSYIPFWQAVIAAIVGSGGTVFVQWMKGKAEGNEKERASELSSNTEFNRQLMEVSGRLPELLTKYEALMKENASLSARAAIQDSRLESLDQRVRLLEQEKVALEQRVTALLGLEAENERLRQRVKELEHTLEIYENDRNHI